MLLPDVLSTNRKWQPRRVLITKEIISFAFVGEEKELDYVPLCEVEFIKEMKDLAVDVNSISDADGTKESFSFQNETIKGGHNSGRPYYIQLRDRESLDQLMALIKKNSKAALKRAQARGTFQRMQYSVRQVYESHPFQIFVAFLIGAVSYALYFLRGRARLYVRVHGSATAPAELRVYSG